MVYFVCRVNGNCFDGGSDYGPKGGDLIDGLSRTDADVWREKWPDICMC